MSHELSSATSQLILLPGNNWTSAETFVSNGSADALNKVTNPDGTKTGLIFDVHKYLDSDNSYVPSYILILANESKFVTIVEHMLNVPQITLITHGNRLLPGFVQTAARP
jgi:hypothetical protein